MTFTQNPLLRRCPGRCARRQRSCDSPVHARLISENEAKRQLREGPVPKPMNVGSRNAGVGPSARTTDDGGGNPPAASRTHYARPIR